MAIDMVGGALAASLVLASVSDEVAMAPPSTYLVPPPPPVIELDLGSYTEDDLTCLAQAIYFEARGESDASRRAVAAVVMNRVKSDAFPDTVCDVVRQGGEDPPCHFSWWCDGLSDDPKDLVAWAEARAIARDMLRSDLDPTDGALYFHQLSVRPYWAQHFERVAQVGSHIYYR